ncbi:MAG: hypothetical protein JWL82_551 [Parcubacteria group bacterium]|nr:hypothetical protein [Parcubacteria group bacterium]
MLLPKVLSCFQEFPLLFEVTNPAKISKVSIRQMQPDFLEGRVTLVNNIHLEPGPSELLLMDAEGNVHAAVGRYPRHRFEPKRISTWGFTNANATVSDTLRRMSHYEVARVKFGVLHMPDPKVGCLYLFKLPPKFSNMREWIESL